MNDEAKDRLIAYINDNIRQAKMRRGFTGKRHLMAREDGYVEALQHVLQQLESPAVDPHSRYAKASFKIDDSSRVGSDEPRENYSSKGNPLPPMPPCYRCGGAGYITHFGRGADDGHDIDLTCPVCNPKYRDYD